MLLASSAFSLSVSALLQSSMLCPALPCRASLCLKVNSGDLLGKVPQIRALCAMSLMHLTFNRYLEASRLLKRSWYKLDSLEHCSFRNQALNSEQDKNTF